MTAILLLGYSLQCFTVVRRGLTSFTVQCKRFPPRLHARKHQIESSLQKAREAKRLRESGEGTSQQAVAESDPRHAQQQHTDDLWSDEALDTDDESIDLEIRQRLYDGRVL